MSNDGLREAAMRFHAAASSDVKQQSRGAFLRGTVPLSVPWREQAMADFKKKWLS